MTAAPGRTAVVGSTTDQRVGRSLVNALYDRGTWSIWSDHPDDGAVDEAPAVALLWSEAAAQTPEILDLARRIEENVLVHVTLGGLAVVPAQFRDASVIDLSQWQGAPTDEVILRIHRALLQASREEPRETARRSTELPPRLHADGRELMELALGVSGARAAKEVSNVDVVLAALLRAQRASVGGNERGRDSASALLHALPEPFQAKIDAAMDAAGVRGRVSSVEMLDRNEARSRSILSASQDLAEQLGAPWVRSHHILGVALNGNLPSPDLFLALRVSQESLRAVLREHIATQWQDEPQSIWNRVLAAPPFSYSENAASVLRAALAQAEPEPVTALDMLTTILRRPPGREDVGSTLRDTLASRVGARVETIIDEVERLFDLPPFRERQVVTAELTRSPAVVDVSESAREILSALGHRPGETIHLRHLLGAALAAPISSSLLDVLRLDERRVRETFVEIAHQMVRGEPADRWRTAVGLDDDVATRDPEVRRVLQGGQSPDLVDPDHGIPRESDALDLDIYVKMLAALIAHHETELPLSIGLFGEWGSGKSFFMGLLRKRVDDLASSANGDYDREIVQIGFNAWTYADSNLWASLGDTIFSRLAAHGTQGNAELLEERRQALRDQLDSTVARGRELEDARDRAQTEAARLRQELETRRAELDRSARAMLEAALVVFSSRTNARENLDGALRKLGSAMK
jgi:hypothetical protein